MLRRRDAGFWRARSSRPLQNPASARLQTLALRNKKSLHTYPVTISFDLVPAQPTLRISNDENGTKKHIIRDYSKSVNQFAIKDGKGNLDRIETREDVRAKCIRCDFDADEDHACSSCTMGRYCSMKCKLENSVMHSNMCQHDVEGSSNSPTSNGRRPAPLPPRPSKKHHKIIYFPNDRQDPEIAWQYVELNRRRAGCTYPNGVGCEATIDLKFDQKELVRWMEDQGSVTSSWMVPLGNQRLILPTNLGHGLILLGLGIAPGHTAHPDDINQSIQALAEPGHIVPVLGPVFVISYHVNVKTGNFVRFGDVNLRDLQHATDFILQSRHHPVVCESWRSPFRDLRQGLKINLIDNPWSRAMNVTQRIEHVMMLRDAVWSSSYPVAKALEMGLRWHVRPTTTPAGLVLQTGDFWNLAVDPMPKLFSHVAVIEKPYSKHDPNVFRGAGGRRCVRYVEMNFWNSFTVFHIYDGQIHPAHVLAALQCVEAAEQLGVGVSEAMFADFWRSFKDAEIRKGHDISDVPSPYDIEIWAGRRASYHDMETEGVIRIIRGKKNLPCD